MRAYLCGVRGSTQAPEPAFARYGGHTSCIALAHEGELPSLIIDGGTGLRHVTDLLDGEPFRGSLLLSHLHWDHAHGLPFFVGGARTGHRVDVLLPAIDGDALATLARGMSPPHFPIGPAQLGVDWTFAALEPGTRNLEGFEVTSLEIPHKGGRTFGFRICAEGNSLAYLSDHHPLGLGPGPDGLGAHHPAAIELARDVDVLVHDAQFLASQFPRVAYLGHSAVEYAVSLAAVAGARSVTLFHHSPDRTDDEIDAIVAACADAPVPVTAAAEGGELCFTPVAVGRKGSAAP
ncbi:MAG: MBL fold metallo-hydrolase [Actinomycetota bacterium]